ncbi:MAG: hypothetical protein AMXMBFR64_55120 [Myxococcales bacterium]
MSRTWASLIGLLTLALCSAAHAETRRYAVVVGHNGSEDPGLAPLRYADDDAIRYWELLRLTADEATLLVDPDEETARLYRSVPRRPPTRAAVLEALATTRERMAADRARGDTPMLYFVYSGHGNYDQEGRGYTWLEGGRFTTRDLYDQVLAPSEGSPVVLIVDACNAALLVNSRGPGSTGDRRRAAPSTMNLEHYPNVGVILSSSSVSEVHEWGRYLAGVFSHEVRSGLLGPADLDGDGAVTFPELAAFVASANDRVANPTLRLAPYIRPPLDRPSLPVVDLRTMRFPARLHIGAGEPTRGWLVDGNLVRQADFHTDGAHAFEIGLTRADEEWVVVTGAVERRVPAGTRGTVALANLPREGAALAGTRGTTDSYFERTLFQEPYGATFANGFLIDTYPGSLVVERLVPVPWYENPLAWSLVGGGLAMAGGGLGVHLWALDAQERANAATFAADAAAANQDIETGRLASGILYGAGAAAFASGVLVFLLDDRMEVERYVPPIRVMVGPEGVSIEGSL